MEVKKKKKRNSFKRICKKTLRAIVNFFINLKNGFMKLKKPVRYIIYVWSIVLLVIIILIIGSSRTASKLDKYHKMEDDFKAATLTYVTKNDLYPNVGKKLKVDYTMLKDTGYLDGKEIIDNTCIGYSIAYYDYDKGEYTIHPYINCKHYTTKNFKDDYDQ